MSEIHDFIERMDALRIAQGMTDRGLSMLATGKPDLVRTIRKRMALPKGDSLTGLAEALGTSIDHLVHGTEIPSDARLSDDRIDFKPQRSQNNLPVLGTAHGGVVILPADSGDDTEVEQTLFEPTQVIKYVKRPRALTDAKDAYAIFVEGDSMAPAFEPADMALVDPRQPPRLSDYVVVQLSENGTDEISAILLKRLVRRSASYIELKQFNPPATFRIDSARVKRIHRILTTADLVDG